MQFTILPFFSFINICIKGEGQTHTLTVWRFLFSAWETCSFPPLFISLLPWHDCFWTPLISPCCDSSLARHGTWKSFSSYFPPAVSCKIRLLCLGERVESFLSLLFLWSWSTWRTIELLLGFLTTQLSLLMEPTVNTVLLTTSICCYGNSGGITDSAQWLLQEKWARL